MTKTKQALHNALQFGWNSACGEIQEWIEDMREEEELTRKQKTLLLELEQHLKLIHNVWRGND